MGDYSGKKASNELGMTRRASGIVFRNSNNNDRSVQHCNRLGCSSRLEYTKGTQTVNPEKAKKFSRFSFRSTSGKASFGSSSKHSLAVNGLRQSLQDEQISISQKERVHAESSSNRQDLEDSESVSTDTSIQTLLSEPEEVESPLLSQGSRYASEASRTSRGTSTSRSQQQIRHQSVMVSPDISSDLLMRRSMSWRNTNQIARPTSPNQGLRNLSCTSISDVLPSGCSSSESGRYSKTDGLERRYDGEGSSRRGGKGTIDKRKSISNHGPSLNEPSTSQQVMRRTRNGPTIEDGFSPVRTRRTLSGDTRPRSQEFGSNHFSSSESNLISQFPLNEFSVSEASSANPSHSFQRQLPSISRHTHGRSGPTNLNIPFRHIEDANPLMSRGPVDRDRYRRFNMEGITEVLLALDRYQQNEEFTNEELLALETSLLYGGFSLHDQHRDMRLDIDDMSYEDLLALEEKMGTVSTALTEEALSNCLKRSFYSSATAASDSPGVGDDDTKCSICQEEYVMGEEVGDLHCGHRYHVDCIHKWLSLKNWCPICKVEALQSLIP